MIGIILCAGLGTRLGKETKDKPKCMVDVGGKPILERIANHLEANGVKKIIVNLHSFPEVVMKYFGQRFLYIYEPVPMGEFATVNLVKGWFPGEEVLVVNGDTLTDFFPIKNRFKHNGYTMYVSDFVDIGTPEGLEKARKLYEKTD